VLVLGLGFSVMELGLGLRSGLLSKLDTPRVQNAWVRKASVRNVWKPLSIFNQTRCMKR